MLPKDVVSFPAVMEVQGKPDSVKDDCCSATSAHMPKE